MKLPQKDEYLILFGNRWECRNIVTVDVFVDNIVDKNNTYKATFYILQCAATQENIQVREQTLIKILNISDSRK